MSDSGRVKDQDVVTEDLLQSVERALVHHFGRSCRIVSFERQPYAYRTSWPLEELTVGLAEGTTLRLIFKDLSRQRLREEVRQVKPDFLHEPCREIETYRSILATADLGTACCYGAVVDGPADRHWLFLEKVAGLELYQIGTWNTWEAAARWLARMHTRYAGSARELARRAPLVVHDAQFYRLWLGRAQACLGESPGVTAQARQQFDRLAAQYDRIVDRLTAWSPTLLHGEFYASNILVEERAGELRICPIDWEMASLGPGLMDLAALSAGKWTDEERAALVRAYQSELPGDMGGPDLAEMLDCCRLQVAVQWLGWAPLWSPPPDHRQDWLSEALRLAEKLGLSY